MIAARKLSYQARVQYSKCAIAKELFTLLDTKKTNLALSADVISSQELLFLADLLGPEICLLKTHIDIIEDFTPALTLELKKLAKKHQFLLFEDRKFADIGHTVKQQYAGGIYRIAEWADMVNAHVLPGPGIIQGLAEVGITKNRGLILLAEMSSAGHLMDSNYISQTVRMAEECPEFVFGFITQHALSENPAWIHFTPGIQFSDQQDQLGQRYVTPQKAILENQTDIIIVGRGIIKAKDPLMQAKRYRKAAWLAYEERMGR